MVEIAAGLRSMRWLVLPMVLLIQLVQHEAGLVVAMVGVVVASLQVLVDAAVKAWVSSISQLRARAKLTWTAPTPPCQPGSGLLTEHRVRAKSFDDRSTARTS